MVKQVILAQCGIRFDEAALRRADIDISNLVSLSPTQSPTQLTMDTTLDADDGTTVTTSLPSPSSPGEDDTRYFMVRSRNDGDVVEQDWPRKQDVVADIDDELWINPIWWLLEFVPIKYEWQEFDGTWKSKWGYVLTRSRLPIRRLTCALLESTWVVAGRLGTCIQLSTTPYARGWLPQTSTTSPERGGRQERNDTLIESRMIFGGDDDDDTYE
jgi:hypothetical protein